MLNSKYNFNIRRYISTANIIKFNSDILDEFKNNLKDIFLDNDEIFDKPEFREYKDNKKKSLNKFMNMV
ncbi:MAG: hypothetical protein V8S33_04900 [Intestinibacter bartlettii]